MVYEIYIALYQVDAYLVTVIQRAEIINLMPKKNQGNHIESTIELSRYSEW